MASYASPFDMLMGLSGGGVSLQESGTSDEAINVGDVVSLLSAGANVGRVQQATSTTAEARVVGIAMTSAGGSGVSVNFQSIGSVAVKFSAVPNTADNSLPVYLSGVAGEATLTPPSSIGNDVIRLGFLTGGNGVTDTPSVTLNIANVITIT